MGRSVKSFRKGNFISKALVLFSIVGTTFTSFGQSNTPCSGSGAPNLPVNASCSYTTGSIGGGDSYQSNTANFGAVSCGSSGEDVWYSFTAPAGGAVTISTQANGITDGVMEAYDADCSTYYTSLGCNDDGGPGLMPELSLGGLTPGNTYYIRFWDYGGGTGTFDICVSIPPPPPANDECTGAIVLTVNPDQSCGAITSSSLASALASAQANTCSGTANDDVWFSFVATGTSHTVDLTNISGSPTDLYHSVYSGTCGSIGAPIVCSDPNSSSVTGLTPGNTYFVRVYSYSSSTGASSTFDVCIGTPPPPPANDECTGAIALTVNPDASCGSVQFGYLSSATASAQANTCSGTANDDVWFSFVATETTHLVDLSNISGSPTDLYHSVYSGTCGSIGAPIVCSDPNSSTVSGLTPGNTYFVRVYSYSSSTGASSTFDICIGTPPPPPANDDCGNAVTLTMSTDGSCNSATSTVASATDSGVSACGGTANDDVWFSFVATNDSAYVDRIADFDSEVEVFDGCAGTSLGCQDGEGAFALTGLTVGNTYLIRIHSWSSTVPSPSSANFSICVFGPAPPPPNVLCANMEPICSDSPITFLAANGGADAETVEPGNNYDCLSTSPNPTWYYLEIATSGVMAIDITAGSDVDFALWGPYTDLSNAQGACGTLPMPIDCSYSSSAVEQANGTAITGEVYVLLITNYADITQGITLKSASTNIATTNCAIVLPVELTHFDAERINNEVALSWVTASEINNDYFIVERSIDAKVWNAIDKVDGIGTSTGDSYYEAFDRNPENEITYYRLKQFDFDGSITISDVISIGRNGENSLKLYPNPAHEDVTIFSSNKFTSLSLIDIQGTIILTNNYNGVNQTQLDLADVGRGIYYVKIESNIGTEVVKLVVKK